MNTVLLMMGGSGTRMGASVPKQFLEVDGKPVFYYVVRAYARMKEIAHICIVCPQSWISFVQDVIRPVPFAGRMLVSQGGENRSQSVKCGLKAVEAFSAADDIILIHDATHPYLDKAAVEKAIAIAKEQGGATLAACQYDTCYAVDAGNLVRRVIPRQEIVSGASPEVFLYGDLKSIYFAASDQELAAVTSAGAMALQHAVPMQAVPTKVLNLKLTYPDDMELFKVLVKEYFFKEGC